MLILALCTGVVVLALMLPVLSNAKGRRSLLLALRSLWLHKLRSVLSVLGIIIGTGAVIALMGFGEGSMHEALEDIKRMGATNIIVKSVKPPDDGSSQRRSFVANYGITYADYARFTTLVGEGVVTRMVPMRIIEPQEIRRQARMFRGRLVATTPQYADIHQVTMDGGRFLTNEDDTLLSNIAVLGSTTAQRLFPTENPVGQSVQMGRYFYRIVGVVQQRNPLGSSGNQGGENFNSDVYVPLQTCRARFGEKIFIRQSGSRSGEKVDFHQVTLTVADIDKVRPTGKVIEQILSSHLKSDWEVTVPLDKLEQAEREQIRYLVLLVMIAGISLLVGGIGIMNIMLATVTERTREIGIRRALGAKQRDITMQFLIEAVVQTSVGGLLGTTLGLSILFVIPPLVEWGWHHHVPAQVSVVSIFLAIGVAVGVGVLFGWYPARRASLLDPIEALRHE